MPSMTTTFSTLPVTPSIQTRSPVDGLNFMNEPPLPVPAPYMNPPKFASPTTSNGRNEPRVGPCQFHVTDAPVFGSTAPIALLETPFSVLNAPPMTTRFEPLLVVRIASTGPSVTGAQADWNAPLAGSTVAL